MKRICVVTGTRAEYGLLFQLMKMIQADDELQLQIIASGMHLSPEFGLTYQQIEADGFRIDKKVEILLSSDTAVGISKTIGLAHISFAEAIDDLSPDMIVVLGDRTEIFALANVALIAGIPIAHIHGGELTEGAYDDAIRHSITKMSHLHFVSTEEYRKRVIQLGEQPSTVYNVGAPGLDNIRLMNLLSKEEFEVSIERKLLKKNLLITFHPVTLEDSSAEEQFQYLLTTLDKLENTLLIFTKPNSDKNGRVIIRMIDDYVAQNTEKSIAFISLGQLRYLSALQYVDAVVGNSSSGIIEVPSFGIPTINIGDRQKGRVAAQSVIHCGNQSDKIFDAINKSLLKDYTATVNPYGDGKASERIFEVIKGSATISLKKQFYNISF
ncbi:UDP-N-acetylglucosamine 2-epimerase (hydrolyzing) [Labilibaculum manganireducens]|uniref:UDP-N-acetylglucosamine 2-epimerase (Hydrolyzing) n=1 Tax=Labilibaculum manganireducens TaxID=1940525 RepID=A0A2N3IEQ1_9BACT|nr:UDP-N-acetylglucosamine 2-epimerase [Labilibaculum manganireducens]PKQ68758.1 UDP-N-acetylglucosamine 2-epimerase (hydrolyzing) [Labilibaculum manganireducens]